MCFEILVKVTEKLKLRQLQLRAVFGAIFYFGEQCANNDLLKSGACASKIVLLIHSNTVEMYTMLFSHTSPLPHFKTKVYCFKD